jgi:hypothetical protein
MSIEHDLFVLRTWLNECGITWRASYEDGRLLEDRQVAAQKEHVEWFPEAGVTSIEIGGEWLPVANIEAVKAIMVHQEIRPAPPKRPGRGKQRDYAAGYKAERFLIEYLAGGPKTAKEVIQAAKDRGISWITVRRARVVTGVVVERIRKPIDHWSWRLGPTSVDWTPPPKPVPPPSKPAPAGWGGDGESGGRGSSDFNRVLVYPKIRF